MRSHSNDRLRTWQTMKQPNGSNVFSIFFFFATCIFIGIHLKYLRQVHNITFFLFETIKYFNWMYEWVRILLWLLARIYSIYAGLHLINHCDINSMFTIVNTLFISSFFFFVLCCDDKDKALKKIYICMFSVKLGIKNGDEEQ